MHQLYFTSSLLTILGGEVFRNQLGGGILPAEPHFRDPAQIYEIDDKRAEVTGQAKHSEN